MNRQQGLIAVAIILGLLLIGAGIWGYQQKKARTELEAEKVELSGSIEELEELRSSLVSEVDSLQEEFNILADENSSLEGSLAQVQEEVAQKEAAIRNIKAQSSSEISNLRAQIQELMALKASLEGNISEVQMENDSLRTLAGQLESDLGLARDENAALSNLNQSMEEEVGRLTYANFKASNFKVSLAKGNDKVTSKARRAKAISTSFNLNNVPPKYQGKRPLYLVMTNETGTPVQGANPIKARTMSDGQPMDIIAVASKEVNLGKDQRLSFDYEFEDKLAAGNYRVAVYSDLGLLGSSNVQLR